MGRAVSKLTKDASNATIVAGVDIVAGDDETTGGFPIYNNLSKVIEPADVVIDFSSPSALSEIISYSKRNDLPVVLCATGYSKKQIHDIDTAALSIPVFRSGNMSPGINLLIDLVKQSIVALGSDYDIEIVEKHHNRKVDAPSGTAIMLADAAAEALGNNPEYIYERHSSNNKRSKNEIGISSVRGGTIVGVHEVIFAGIDEVIELKHTAASRDVFAVGALMAAKFMVGKKPGLYNMSDVLRKKV